MKFDICSDLHLDHYLKYNSNYSSFIKRNFKEINSDNLIIAGDLSNYNNITMEFLLEIKKYYKNIIITWGNHDLYMIGNRQKEKYEFNSFNRIKEIKEFCKNNKNIYYLDGNIIEINGIRIAGTGNWYNLPNEKTEKQWEKVMNDSRYIFEGNFYNENKILNSQKLYFKEKAKLENFVNKNIDILITHVSMYQPTLDEGLPLKYIRDLNNIFYYTDSIELLKRINPKIYIFGHTHEEYNFKKDNINIYCNTLGYPGEKQFKIKTIKV